RQRYHGLLVAATKPPVGREMLLSRLGEILLLDGRSDPMFEFSCNQFGHRLHPRGDQHLRKFQLDEHVAHWEYDVDGVTIIKELQLPWLTNAAGVRYTIKPNRPRQVEFWLLPFVALRDFHG